MITTIYDAVEFLALRRMAISFIDGKGIEIRDGAGGLIYRDLLSNGRSASGAVIRGAVAIQVACKAKPALVG